MNTNTIMALAQTISVWNTILFLSSGFIFKEIAFLKSDMSSKILNAVSQVILKINVKLFKCAHFSFSCILVSYTQLLHTTNSLNC